MRGHDLEHFADDPDVAERLLEHLLAGCLLEIRQMPCSFSMAREFQLLAQWEFAEWTGDDRLRAIAFYCDDTVRCTITP